MAYDTPTDELSPRQYKALSAMLESSSIRQAAAAAGIPEKTLYNWKKEPAFERAYWDALREKWAHTKGVALTVANPMLMVLVRVASKETARDADRISAASKVLDIALKVIELDDMEQRLKQLEERYATS